MRVRERWLGNTKWTTELWVVGFQIGPESEVSEVAGEKRVPGSSLTNCVVRIVTTNVVVAEVRRQIGHGWALGVER